MMNKNVPQLRFDGFIEEWVLCKLGELLKSEASKMYITDPSDGKYPVIQQGDKSVLGYSDKMPFSNFKSVVLFGDHTLSLFKPITPFLVATDGIKIIYSDLLERDFFYIFLQKYNPDSQGYKRHFSILKNEVGYYTINVEEQQKIGTFFKRLDNTIDFHQSKLELLKEQKKGFLQKMFPKNDEKIPELRFQGFTDDWEQDKLGDITDILTGGTPKTSISEYWEPKKVPWMSSGEVNKRRLNKTDNMISEEGLNNSSARWIKEHSILIALAGQGKTRGTVAVNNIRLTTNQSIAAIVPNEKLHYEFIYQNLSKRYEELRMISSGDGTRGGLNKQIIVKGHNKMLVLGH